MKMDIREIDGLWCDDITFCQETCERMDCPRNKHHIRDRSVPHSFSVEIPQDCPKKQEGGEVGMKELIIKVDDPSERAWDGSSKVFETKELVRCKDCEYACICSDDWVICTHIDSNGNDKHPCDWFCADGEQRQEGR